MPPPQTAPLTPLKIKLILFYLIFFYKECESMSRRVVSWDATAIFATNAEINTDTCLSIVLFLPFKLNIHIFYGIVCRE